MLLESDIELAPGAREQAFIQRFYLYRNLTKPSRQLYMSYARIDREGKALRPSYLVAVIRRIFPKLELKEYEEIEAADDFYTKEAAADYLIHGKKDEAWFALAKWFMDTDEAENEKITGLLTAAYCCYKKYTNQSGGGARSVRQETRRKCDPVRTFCSLCLCALSAVWLAAS